MAYTGRFNTCFVFDTKTIKLKTVKNEKQFFNSRERMDIDMWVSIYLSSPPNAVREVSLFCFFLL